VSKIDEHHLEVSFFIQNSLHVFPTRKREKKASALDARENDFDDDFDDFDDDDKNDDDDFDDFDDDWNERGETTRTRTPIIRRESRRPRRRL
jgi:hypothetical protein